MRNGSFLFLLFLWAIICPGQYHPADDLGELFVDVQTSGIFEDSKTFADAVPKVDPDSILKMYNPEFSDAELAAFVSRYFIIPKRESAVAPLEPKPIETHIDSLWGQLLRKDTPTTGSLIELPHPYVVPGGRFNEMYYWDSYFTMLGLQEAGRYDMIRDMLRNFAWMINEFGFIPNGTRTYYLSRSQPPFFSLMVELLAQIDGDTIYTAYLGELQQEYDFWMQGKEELNTNNPAFKNVVRLDEETVLNRYWDSRAKPRPEAYLEDIRTAEKSGRPAGEVYRDIRAACESGWDFSSRWLGDGLSLHTIHTTEIIPVDLNSLLYHHEKILAKAYRLNGQKKEGSEFLRKAEKRKAAILRYCYNDTADFFMDYDFKKCQTTAVHSAAGLYPLFFKIADSARAAMVAAKFTEYFLQEGGIPATVRVTGQQWDAPNGWAPLQWISYRALKNYAYDALAEKLRERWIKAVREEYRQTGKLMEKYNMFYPSIPGGGGEYPTQDGFGWTNAVYLKMAADQP